MSHSQLVKIFEDTLNQMVVAKQFDLGTFLPRMEKAFVEEGFREEQTNGVENILVLRLDAAGDFIVASGAIREIRANYPSAYITLVVRKYVYPLAELCPYVNEVLYMELPTIASDIQLLLKEIFRISSEHLWKRHYSMCFCLGYWGFRLPALLTCHLSGAYQRIGYRLNANLKYIGRPINPNDEALGNFIFTRVLDNPPEIMHEAARNFYILTALGLRINSTDIELWYNHTDIKTARRLMNKSKESNTTYIIAGIASYDGVRKYSMDKYSSAFKQIIDKQRQRNNAIREGGGGIRIVVVGGAAESEDAKSLQSKLPKGCVINLTGQTTLRETAAIIAESDMYIGNDTGTMHMAAAAHIPMIAVYRQAKDKCNDKSKGFSSELDLFSPWQTTAIILRPKHALGDCQNVLSYGGCKENFAHCINQIKPKEIVEAFEHLMYLKENTHQKSANRQTIIHNINQMIGLYSK